MRSGPSILAALLLVPVLGSGALFRNGGATLDEELGRDLNLALTDVKPWPGPFPESLGRSVAEKLLLQSDLLAGARVFLGRGTIPGSQKPEDLVLVRLGLGAPLAGARLICAVHADGRLAHAAIHGRAEFDEDEELAWNLFLGQLCSYGCLGPPEEFAPHLDRVHSPREIADALARISEPGADGELLSALVHQRLAMRGFTLLQRRMILLPNRLPPAEWLAEKGREFEGLGKLSSRFQPVLGDKGAEDHRRRAGEAGAFLSELEEIARAGDVQEFRAASGRMRSLCRECHGLPTENRKNWDDAFSELRSELGLPSGLFRVGYDVAPALGDPGGSVSQRVADAVHGVLLLVDGLTR